MPENRHYCALRSNDGAGPAVYTSWKITQPHVRDTEAPSGLGASVVFHAFPSLAEVKAYCNAAGVAMPPVFTRAFAAQRVKEEV
jgi:hypothetical protein